MKLPLPKTDLRMTPDEVIACVEPAGLTLAQVVEVPPYHYAAIFECDRLR